MKREPNIWENMFANDNSDKGSISKINKELTQLHTRKRNNQLKIGQRTWTDTSPRRTYKRAKRHMKGCSASLAIREMQIKTTIRYHFTSIIIIYKSTNNKCWQGCGEKGSLMHCWLGMQTGAATMENSMEFPQKTKNGTAFWPSNSTAGFIPKES